MKKVILTWAILLPLSLLADMDRCVSCHGVDFEKKALGSSKIVKNMTESQIKASLDGYKRGEGGSMKDIMIKEVNVGVDTDAMAADIYNEIITPGFEEPDAEFIFRKRRTVRGLFKIKQLFKNMEQKKDKAKMHSQIKSFAFDLYTYDSILRKKVDANETKAKSKPMDVDSIFQRVSSAKKCTDHSFSEEALIKCQADFIALAKEISLKDAEKIKHKIKPKEKMKK